MQRKMKLIRKILEYVERAQTEESLPAPEFEDYTEAQVHYHLGLCEEAGYLALHQPRSTEQRRFPGILRMTWAGHEALDSMRGEQATA